MSRAEHPADGRWQRGETVEGFYLAGDEQTAWGEWYRALSELAVPPMRQMPRDLWRFEVRVEGVADLSNADRLAAVGLPLPVPARGQWPRFQAVGEALASNDWRGVLYPSASRSAGSGGNLALCLFRRTSGIPGIDPAGPPTRYEEPPAPPTGLRTWGDRRHHCVFFRLASGVSWASSEHEIGDALRQWDAAGRGYPASSRCHRVRP